MSIANTIASGGTVPEQYAEATTEMSNHIKQVFAVDLPEAEKTQVQAIRFNRDEAGNVLMDDDGTPQLVALTDQGGHAVLEDHPLVHRFNNHGLHAYRYEEQDDGSVLALYVNDPSGEVKMKAFDTLEEASLWSPRDERK